MNKQYKTLIESSFYRIKISTVLLIFGGVLNTLSAQEVKIWSLDSCKTLALQNQVKLKNADLEIEAAKQTKNAAFTRYFPTISAQGAAYVFRQPFVDVNSSESDLDVTLSYNGVTLSEALQSLSTQLSPILGILGIDLNTMMESFREGFQVEASMIERGMVGGVTALQPIFAGGRIVNGNKLAALGIEASLYQKEAIQKEVLLKTEQSYWFVISLQEKMKTIDQLSVLLDTLYRDVKTAYDAGLVPKNDLLKVKLKQNEIRSAYIALKNGIALARMSLCQYIGEAYTEHIVLSDSLREIQPPWGLKTDFGQSVMQRTEYKLLDLNVKVERVKKNMIMGEALPQLAIGGGLLYNNIFGGDATNAVLFATASIPLTAWWETSHQIKKQKIKLQIAENTKTDFSQLLQLQMQQTWNEVEETYNQIALKTEAVEEAQENLISTQHYYEAGMVSLSDFLEAQTLLQQSRDQYIEQCITYKVKLMQYRLFFHE